MSPAGDEADSWRGITKGSVTEWKSELGYLFFLDSFCKTGSETHYVPKDDFEPLISCVLQLTSAGITGVSHHSSAYRATSPALVV